MQIIIYFIISNLLSYSAGKIPIHIAEIIQKNDEASNYIIQNALRDETRLDDSYELVTHSVQVEENDCYVSTNALCKFSRQTNGSVVFLNSAGSTISPLIYSLSHYLGVPLIDTDWQPRNMTEYDNTFSVYPEATLLAQAYEATVESFDWTNFAVVYESEESLVRMQDVLKLQEYNADSKKDGLILKKLDESGDSRHIFKAIKNAQIYCVVLDCSADKIIDVLQQAKDVKLLDDLNTNIFLTSLDAHTLNYSSLNTRSNITTVRLFNPLCKEVEIHARKFYPLRLGQVTVKMALMHDAMLLLAESFSAIKSTHDDNEIVYEPLFCNATEKYDDKYGLVSALRERVVTGISGEISLNRNKRRSFQIDIIEMERPEKPIGYWNATEPNKVFLTRNATEREAELQERLQRRNFIVASRIGEPYLYKSKEANATGNARYYGYSMDLIGEIAKILKITFEFRITADNAYPNLQKDLIEGRADLAICDFTITPQRRQVIDFSMPFMSLGIGILHKENVVEEEENLYGFLGPLCPVVWMYIGVLYLFISLTLVVIARLSTKDWENPHPCDENPSELENIWDLKNSCWLTLGSITTQGCDILPKGGCTRIATASWWFFSLIITSSYTANLAAFLTKSKTDVSIDNVQELAEQSQIKYGCMSNGATANFFQLNNNSLYQRMWNTMINERPSVFEGSNSDGVERVESTKNGLYAFFMESTTIDFEMRRRCNLRRIGDLLDSKSYGIGMPLNFAYRHSINKAVLELQETGKLLKLKTRWWQNEGVEKSCPGKQSVNSEALALENVGGVFIVLVAGIGIAFLIAILEFLWNVRSISVEEHISYLEALKIELKFACNIFVTRKRVKPIMSESSSEKSDNDIKSNKGILIGAGSILNINRSIINRLGSSSTNSR
ncbi:hypothetical protein ABEB36_012237 [Hypothenemus hampei]|uniref:Uncharacterized protein n=1 Tax=Hypothenemus hampei TaxID=57062 RepID=A0ABD1EAL9_HYPHA